VEGAAVRRAHVDRYADAAGNDIRGARLDVDLPHRPNRGVDARGEVADAQDVVRGGHERVLPAGHRHRAGVARLADEDSLPADDADDAAGETDRRTGAFQHRALLDMHLEEALGQLPAFDERRAPDAARLLLPKDDDCTLAHALDRLERGDDAES